jgi:hypothetical protein
LVALAMHTGISSSGPGHAHRYKQQWPWSCTQV